MESPSLQETLRRRRVWTVVGVCVAVLLVLAVVAVIVTRSDGGDGGGGVAGGATPSTPATPSTSADRATPSSEPPSGTTTPPAAPHVGFSALWPFSGPAAAAAWQQSYRAGGHQPWHLDPAATALSFTQDYLGYREVDEVVSRRVAGTEAWIGVGYTPQPDLTATAAVVHLARIGAGADAPWEVVGTRDTSLSLTKPAYGATVSSPLTVGGRVSGVDESLVTQLRVLGRPVLARSAGVPAGGERTPWSTRLAFNAPRGAVLTVAVATGGHVQGVERFAITGATVG